MDIEVIILLVLLKDRVKVFEKTLFRTIGQYEIDWFYVSSF